MSAEVVSFWYGPWASRIRIPGPTENKFNAAIIILPVVRYERTSAEPEVPPICKAWKPADANKAAIASAAVPGP